MSSLPYNYLFEENEYTRLAGDRRDIEYLKRRFYETGSVAGSAIYAIEVFEIDVLVTAGDGAFEWPIPEDLDGATLLKVEGGVNTASSSGSVEVQLHLRNADGSSVGDMLTDKIVIEAGERHSALAATQPTVNPANEEVAHTQFIRVDVDAAGVDTLGLHVIAYFVPLASKALAIQGAKGDPGGVTAWTGQWQTATGYTEGQAVSNNGSSYVAIGDHTSGATTEPGVGVDWEDEWMLLAQAQATSAIEVSVGSNIGALDTGVKAFVHVPFACTIIEATLLANTVGDLVMDIWKDTYGNHPPTNADSITGASPLTLASASKTTNTALTGWTTALAAGDVLAFHIDSAAIISRLTCSLTVERI